MCTRKIFVCAVAVIMLGYSISFGEKTQTEQSVFVTDPNLWTAGRHEDPFITKITNSSYKRFVGYYRSQGYSTEDSNYLKFKRSITFICPCSVYNTPMLFLPPRHYEAGTFNVLLIPGNVYQFSQWSAEAKSVETVFAPGGE